MWFKNLRLFHLTEPFAMAPDALHQALSHHPFEPCGNLDETRYGWVPPLGRHGTEYVHAANGYIMICAKKQEKVLPAAVVNEALEERVVQLSQEENRPVGRKERQSLKDEVIFSLMPKAFAKSSLHFAYIAPKDNLLVVNASSAKGAEDLIAALRDALGSLKVIPVVAKNLPTQVMTHWLQNSQAPRDFELGEECEMQAGTDSRVVRCKNIDLTADELRNHIETGMHVKKLSLVWNDAIECVVDDELSVKRLKFSDAIQDKAEASNAETATEQFDADFAVMTVELSAFIRSLLDGFGGRDTT